MTIKQVLKPPLVVGAFRVPTGQGNALQTDRAVVARNDDGTRSTISDCHDGSLWGFLRVRGF